MLSILIPHGNDKRIDAFIAEVRRIMPDAEVVVTNDVNGKGKGWAIREAFKRSTGEYVAFIDGDGDIPPKMLRRLYPFIEDFDVVVGTKSVANAPLHRKIITHLSRLYVRAIFGLSCDTQTGIKMFRREVLGLWETDGFLFDVEILISAKKHGGNIIEIPIEAEITSSMSIRTIWKTFKESLKILFRS